MEWMNQMSRALDKIEASMEQQVDIAEIAQAACSSTFHFQRMFHMLTGVTVGEYIRKRRLTMAAQELATSQVKVIDLALKYGYESPEAFTKAFRNIHGITPTQARQPGASLKAFPRISFHLSLKGDKDVDYRIEQKAGFDVIGKAIQTTCENDEQTRAIPAFWGQCYQNGTIPALEAAGADKPLLGIMLDMVPNKELFTYMIGCEASSTTGSTTGSMTSNANNSETAMEQALPDMVRRSIPGSTWAIFTGTGNATTTIQPLFCRIYQEWFPSTGYEHAGTPEMEVYLPGDVMADDYRYEIWIPIVKRTEN